MILLLITFAAFLSYWNNFFKVTYKDFFETHQNRSEQLVLDGILHGSDGSNRLKLGRYFRPNLEENHQNPRELYSEKNKDGEFREYKSQFGLQVYLFSFLAETFDRDVRFLHAFTAFLMSLIVGLFFIAVQREFSLIHAVFFTIPLIVSPWVVVFARNLYWIEATWFLPTVITLMYGKRAFTSTRGALLMGFMLFAAFLLKFLCGYEYLTTIGLSACVPLAYFARQYHHGFKGGFIQFIICGSSLMLAFVFAIFLHTQALSSDSSASLNTIKLIAEKRLSSSNPELLAKEYCKDSPNPEECEEQFLLDYGKSLTANRFHVAATYFKMREFLPWIDSDMNNSGNIFLFFILIVCIMALKRKDSLSFALLISFLAPLSWFTLAKGHSYLHTNLNYVLWFLPYVPIGMLILSPQKIPRWNKRAKK